MKKTKAEENFDAMYEIIMDNIFHSHSSLTTFESCPYAYKLTYVERKERVNNFFAEYGLLVHKCIEEYFSGNLDAYDLSDYFRRNYNVFVVTPPPPYPRGMEGKYMTQGEEFFDNFSFNKNDYDILSIEADLKFTISGIDMTGRPDVILQEEANGEVILLDYKTSYPFKYSKYTKLETPDKTKIDGYFRQMYLYCYALEQSEGLQIDRITLWFIRAKKEVSIVWDKEEQDKAIDWAEGVVNRIREEKDFMYNNSNSYFCNFLCGVRDFCEYRPETS